MTTPTRIESWAAIPRDLDINDHSRSGGSMTKADRSAAERVTNLGGGLTQVTYLDTLTASTEPQG